jgi:hypothetical protein
VFGQFPRDRAYNQPLWDGDPTVCSSTVVLTREKGQIIAIGYADGLVRLHSVESATLVHEFTLGNLVDRIWWVRDAHDDVSDDNDGIVEKLPRLPPLNMKNNGATSIFAKRMSDSGEESHIIGPMSLLLVSTLQDRIFRLHLSLFGIFHVGYLPLKLANLVQAGLDNDKLILLESEGLSKVDLGLVRTKRTEMKRLARQGTMFNMLATYLSQSISHLEQEARGFIGLATKYVGFFDDLVLQSGQDTTSKLELIRAIVVGKRSEMVDKFLGEELGERVLKQWERSVDASVAGMARWNAEYCQPCCGRILLHLSNLRGLARRQERFEDMGISLQEVDECIANVYILQRRLKQVDQIALNYLAGFRPFMSWMMVGCLELSEHSELPIVIGDELEMVDFIETALKGDSLEPFFKGDEALKATCNLISSKLTTIMSKPAESICKSINSKQLVPMQPIPNGMTCGEGIYALRLEGNLTIARLTDEESFVITKEQVTDYISSAFNIRRDHLRQLVLKEASFFDDSYLVVLVDWTPDEECPEDVEFLPEQALLLVDHDETLNDKEMQVIGKVLFAHAHQDEQMLVNLQVNPSRKLVSLLGDERRRIVLVDVEGEETRQTLEK